jgi:hypothetical protein
MLNSCQNHLHKRVGRRIVDCQLPNADWLSRKEPIGNRKSTIGNVIGPPANAGGSDMALQLPSL